MLPKHENYCALLRNAEDRDILTRRLFDVNMRLFKVNSAYRGIIYRIASYILWCAQTEKEGYKKPHGYSGANAGIPFNIIATDHVMLNPKVIKKKGKKVSRSNCGSLLLKEPINIWRYEEITFEYWDLDGMRHEQTGYLPTIQHEIDHNNGVLITDLQVHEENWCKTLTL